MTKVETTSVVGCGGDAGGLSSIIRGVARAAISAAYVRAASTTFEGGA